MTRCLSGAVLVTFSEFPQGWLIILLISVPVPVLVGPSARQEACYSLHQSGPRGATAGSGVADVPPGSWSTLTCSSSAMHRISTSGSWVKLPSVCCRSIFLHTFINRLFPLPALLALSAFFKNNFSLLVVWFNKVILLISVKGLFLLATTACTSVAPHYHGFRFKLSSLKVTCFLTHSVKPDNDLMTPEQAHIKITDGTIINNY